jgi:allophanate hydrolase
MSWDELTGSLDFSTLRTHYAEGTLRPADVIRAVYRRIAARGDDHVWIHLVPEDEALARAAVVEATLDRSAPLYGLPCGIKDNIDVPGMPSTNAFPPSWRIAETTGPAVQRLLDAGAIVIGKTNMDQFGVGLVGVRTPYGVARNAFDAAFVPGGSSAGSGVAVGAGLVSFAPRQRCRRVRACSGGLQQRGGDQADAGSRQQHGSRGRRHGEDAGDHLGVRAHHR